MGKFDCFLELSDHSLPKLPATIHVKRGFFKQVTGIIIILLLAMHILLFSVFFIYSLMKLVDNLALLKFFITQQKGLVIGQ